MPLLLEDLAEETSASNARAAERLDAEARSLEELRPTAMAREELQRRVAESCRYATEYVLGRVPQAEAVWTSVVAALRTQAYKDAQERLLRRALTVFESGSASSARPGALWRFAEAVGISLERQDELERAERRFAELSEEANAALRHRTEGWQPAAPDRLAEGLRLALEGKALTADEARARFRRTKG